MTTTMAAPTFARENHPVGEITLSPRRRKTSRVSALIGYRLEGPGGLAMTVTRVDVADFVAYDTDK
jgi:hypothetical protein